MNKKFSTLMAGLLLAGGYTSNAFAEKFVATTEYGDQYYHVVVDSRGTIQEGSQWLDVNGTVAKPDDRYSLENDLSTKWTVKKVTSKVNGQTQVIGFQLISALTNQPLSVTVKENDKDVTYDTFGTEYKSLYYVKPDGTIAGKYYIGKDGELSSNYETEGYWVYDLQVVPNAPLSKDELEKQNGDSFSLQIGYQEDKNQDGTDEWYEYTPFEGENVFAGKLYVGNGNETDGYALYKDAKKTQRIVLTTQTWDKTSADLGEGFIFDVLNKKEYDAANTAGDKIKADKFIISVPSTVLGEPIEVIATNGDETFELVVSVVKDKNGKDVNRLTVGSNTTDNTADYTKANTTAKSNTYVKFGQSNLIDMTTFIGKIWNIEKDGKIASPECNNDYVPTSQVAKAYPEGQWLWNNKTQTFVNRESGKQLNIVGLREDANPNDRVYVTADGETFTFTEAGTPGETSLGYLNGFSEDQLKYNAFVIGSPIATTKDTIYLANGKDGALTFTEDKADAVQFNLTIANECDKHANAQIRNEYTAWKDQATKEPEQKTDVVNFWQYTITEALTGKVLCYDYTNKCYALASEEEIDAPNSQLSKAGKFLFKNKGVNTYNIVRGEYSDWSSDEYKYEQGIYTVQADKDAYHATVAGISFCGGNVTEKSYAVANKLYNAFQSEKLVQSESVYKETQNDLFVITPALAEQYRSDFSDKGVLDTIKIFRKDDPNYVLYEKGTLLANAKGEAIEGFLGMENIQDPEYADMHAALLADTAFHANTFRPQYMLAVDAEIVNDGWTCPLNDEHNTQEWREEHGGHCADAVKDRPYVQGRYLVNLIDSANTVTSGANKFMHEGFNRLGFVHAKHLGDSLIIASTKDTIDLAADRPNDKVCTFAFKYVDAAREAFTIETLGKYTLDDDGDVDEIERGYIKYQNGVPVVTLDQKEAWVFNLEELSGEENAPTANENITAGSVVVAGVNGAVVVKGAEGKNVIVSTILGKVVANETVSSDNATIAAPQGVVVVSVDGESFKVVVK